MPTIVQIADALVGELNSQAFGQAFTATRGYRPVFDFEDMNVLHVTVVPKGVTVVRFDRERWQEDHEIDVAVQKKTEAVDNATLDPLAAFVERLSDWLRGRRLEAMKEAVCVGVANEPVWVPEHLTERGEFTSVLTLTYRIYR